MNCDVEKTVCLEDKNSHRESGKANYLVSIAVAIILLYFFNNLIYLNIPFLTKDIVSCLWAVNLTLGLGIIGNFVLLLYRPRWFIHLIKAVINGLGILAVLIVYKIFPFSLANENFQLGVKILLIIVMAGIGVGFIIELIRTFRAIASAGNSKPPESASTDYQI